MATCRHKLGFSVVSVLGFLLLLTAFAIGQSHPFGSGTVAPRGVPASVTSFGFGGHPGFHGVPASVTSQGFGARTPFRGTLGTVTAFGFRGPRHVMHHRSFEFNHHHRGVGFIAPVYGGYYAPYDYSYADDNYAEDEAESNEIRAQRAYDERQAREEDYRAELNSKIEQQATPTAQPEPVSNQPTTVLIFKDGHQLEIANYAIVGSMLYDLSNGRSKRIQLAELDLPATVKENDDRGVEFQLPAQAKLN